jgi:16S rRNA (adenine1518-N6/adenine1519-N6)-dimethyltransferase
LEILFTVPPTAFVPRPTVESAVIRLTARPDTLVAESDEESFRSLVQRCFSQRRKQMQKILRHIHGLSAARAGEVLLDSAIEPAARPETLSPADFARLLAVLQR